MNTNRYVPQKFSFNKPKIVGYFSIDEDDNISPDISELKYLYSYRNFSGHMDLNIGMENVIVNQINHRGKMDHILKNLLENKERFMTVDPSNSRIICSRSSLVAIAQMPYLRYKVRILATYFKGDIYLCVLPTGKEFNTDNHIPCHWGYKFEQYMLTHDPDVPPKTDVPVNEIAHFFFILAGKLGNHDMLYAAEADGKLVHEGDGKIPMDLSPDEMIDRLQKATFVELKTVGTSMSKIKMLKWYLQSKFGGVDKILCGKHTGGVVEKTEDFSVDSLASNLGNINTVECMNFCNRFLTEVKNTFQNRSADRSTTKFQHLHYELSKHPQESSGRWQLTDNFTENELFLPSWFTDNWN